jgi:electron transport complex protein RnfC
VDDRIELVRGAGALSRGRRAAAHPGAHGREVPYDGLPIDIGFVCQNLGTAAAVADALEGRALTSRIVTVTGPGVRQGAQRGGARLGTPVADLVTLCGGYAENVQRLIMGGPMMGFALGTDAVPVVKATNCLLALTGRRCARRETNVPASAAASVRARLSRAAAAAGAVSPDARRAFEQVQALHVFDCIECGCCDVVCPSHIPLTHILPLREGRALGRRAGAASSSGRAPALRIARGAPWRLRSRAAARARARLNRRTRRAAAPAEDPRRR